MGRVGGQIETIDLQGLLDGEVEPPDGLRLFAGYSGWGPGQLEGEIAADAWFTVEAFDGDVFGPHPESLWRDVLRRQGGRSDGCRCSPTARCSTEPSAGEQVRRCRRGSTRWSSTRRTSGRWVGGGPRRWVGDIGFESDDEIAVVDPDDEALALVFVPVDDPKTVKNRIHLDLASRLGRRARPDRRSTPRRRRDPRGHRAGPDVSWVVLADPEGNEFCVLGSERGRPRSQRAGLGGPRRA